MRRLKFKEKTLQYTLNEYVDIVPFKNWFTVLRAEILIKIPIEDFGIVDMFKIMNNESDNSPSYLHVALLMHYFLNIKILKFTKQEGRKKLYTLTPGGKRIQKSLINFIKEINRLPNSEKIPKFSKRW
jgi:predicted transcriptional regulator